MQSKIQVTLAIALVTAAIALYKEMGALGDKIEARYISKELFQAEIGSLRRERAIEFKAFGEKLDAYGDKLSEVKADVSSLRSGR